MIEFLWRVVLPAVLAAITTYVIDHFELLSWQTWLVYVVALIVWLVVINLPEHIDELYW